MAFATKNDVVSGRKPVPTVSDACVAAPRFEQACVAADSALDNVGVIGILPAGYEPVLPMVVDTTGLGGSAAVSIGILDEATGDISTNAADGGAAWASAVSVGSAAVTQIAPTAAYVAVKKAEVDRKIAVKFTTVGSTAGTLGLTVPYRTGD
jgi:hypothetical protein